jgi:hypothetical protein
MDEGFNNIEDLLKGTLDGYKKQPSPKVWRAGSLKLFFSSSLFYASVFILLIGIGFGSYYYFRTNNTAVETSPENKVFVSPKNETGTLEVSAEKKPFENSNKKSNNEQLIANNKTTDNKQNTANSIIETGNEKVKPESNSGFARVTGSNVAVTSLAIANKHSVKRPVDQYPGLPGLNDNINRMTTAEPLLVNRLGYSLPEYLSFTSAYKDFDLVPKSDYGRLKGAWSVGAFVTPEVIFLNDEEKSTKKAINFDVTGVYGEDFFVEAGVGVALSEDNGRFNINYSQYDSVGYFYQVNSFEIDPVTGEPVFKTTLEGLYDTVDYQTSETVNNLYTYLRIPLYAGYKIREFKGFSVYLKAGGIYSVLVGSNESGADYTNDNATSIIIEDETPQRVHSYFKLSASVGVSYQLSNSVSLSLEPVYNYYMQPVYERRLSDKSPWSLGLRFGVLVKIK